MNAPIHVTQTTKGLRSSWHSVRPSFVLVICAILFLITAVAVNFDLHARYESLTWGMAHLQNGPNYIAPPWEKADQIELAKLRDQRSKNEIIQGSISGVLLFAALWVILSKRYTPTDRHWAYGTVGTLVGFWLGSAS